MRISTFAALAVASVGVLGGPALAATVSSQSGEVLVNDGTGFEPIGSSVDAAIGSQIMVRSGGVALITYSSECAVRVGSERIWVIQDKAPCTDGARLLDFTGRMGVESDTTPSPAIDSGTLVVGGLVVGGVVGAVILLSDDDDDYKPASP